tara:strand:+ start:158 stop:700 length:543 start_codon:yes stop_codon:yes gene_type:complete
MPCTLYELEASQLPKISQSFDPQAVEWRHAVDRTDPNFLIDYEYSLLGYDLDSGRLDMLLRFTGNGGHCQRHRHIASTMTLVLDGEQHVDEIHPDGSISSIVRKNGDYALAEADALPHNERGGPNGGIVFLANSAPDGRLFEYFDEYMNSVRVLTITEYVKSWELGSVPGALGRKRASAA